MSKKVLLVDDSNTALMMERMILSCTSYTLLTAQDGLEAVEKARLELPDLILMDVVMPKLNGFEACKRIKEQEATRAIPVIMVTTRGEAENVQAGWASGCNDYITKPINSSELVRKMRELLGE